MKLLQKVIVKTASGAMWFAILMGLFLVAINIGFNASIWLYGGTLYFGLDEGLPIALIVIVVFAICRIKKGLTPRAIGICWLVSFFIPVILLAIIHWSHPNPRYHFLENRRLLLTTNDGGGFYGRTYTFKGDLHDLERQAAPELERRGLHLAYAEYALIGANNQEICRVTAVARNLGATSPFVSLAIRQRLERLGMRLKCLSYESGDKNRFPSHLVSFSTGRVTGKYFYIDGDFETTSPDPDWVTVNTDEEDVLSYFGP